MRARVKKISLRIRKEYFDQIVAGQKVIEYRACTPFWEKRLMDGKVKIAVFICGYRTHRRKIKGVIKMLTPSDFSEQGQKDVPTKWCFAIRLGDVVTELN